MANTFTNRDFFSAIINDRMPILVTDEGSVTMTHDDLVNWAKHNIELLNKRASAPRKAKAPKYDVVSLEDAIMAKMRSDAEISASEIISDTSYDWGSIQRVSTRLRALADAGKLVRVEGKKKDPIRYRLGTSDLRA